jgi:hypothetical protein
MSLRLAAYDYDAESTGGGPSLPPLPTTPSTGSTWVPSWLVTAAQTAAATMGVNLTMVQIEAAAALQSMKALRARLVAENDAVANIYELETDDGSPAMRQYWHSVQVRADAVANAWAEYRKIVNLVSPALAFARRMGFDISDEDVGLAALPLIPLAIIAAVIALGVGAAAVVAAYRLTDKSVAIAEREREYTALYKQAVQQGKPPPPPPDRSGDGPGIADTVGKTIAMVVGIGAVAFIGYQMLKKAGRA